MHNHHIPEISLDLMGLAVATKEVGHGGILYR